MALSRIDTTNMIEDVPQSKIDNNINFRNIIINGDMSLAQRGTSISSISSGAAYNTIDRMRFGVNSLGTWTQSQSTDVPTGQGFAKSFKLDCTTADASPGAGDYVFLNYNIEGQDLQYLKKGTANAESLTLSFWTKSNKTGTYTFELDDNDNSRSFSQTYTISSANTWEKKTITFAGDTTGALDNDNNNSLRFYFWLGAGSNYTSGTLQTSWQSTTDANRVSSSNVNLADSTSNEWYITGVQLEAGQTASEFEFLPVDVNLRRCQRYFFEYGVSDSKLNNTGIAFNTGELNTNTSYPEIMRATPTLTFFDNAGNSARIHRNGSGDHGNAVSAVNQNNKKLATVSSTSLTSGGGYAFRLKGEAEL